MLHVLVLLLATVSAAAADGDSTDPIRAFKAPTKTKNLADDFAARKATVAAGSPGYWILAITCLTTV
jgi:hypothetical protein